MKPLYMYMLNTASTTGYCKGNTTSANQTENKSTKQPKIMQSSYEYIKYTV